MPINDNKMDLAEYKGKVKPCPLCSNRPQSAALDALTSGRACTMCLGHGFVSECTNCQGTGQFKGRTVWDSGRAEHISTCTPCGGKGAYATRKPADWPTTSSDPVSGVAPEVAKEVIDNTATTV